MENKENNIDNKNNKKNWLSIKSYKPQEKSLHRPSLKIIPLGGTTTVQKNMYVYECGNDIIVMDCGVGFPDVETPGVDLIIPDFSYIIQNRAKVKAIVITHGHNDHISSLPYLLQQFAFPVYAVGFVKALIEKSLSEFHGLDKVVIKEFDPDQSFQLGCFRLHPFRVNHSIPDTLGFAIDTPQGRVFHNTDYKFDWSPVMGKPFDIQKAAFLAREPKEGVLALLSDCLGSTSDGFTKSEKYIEEIFDQIMSKSHNSQLFITTVSSNISRIQQAINSSVKAGRKVVLTGRSIRNSMEVAMQCGYIKAAQNVFVEERDALKMDQGKLTYIITGSYGQRESALWRVVMGEHRHISLAKNSVVVFSADPIPSSLMAVNALIDELFLNGVEVYYSEIQDNLHVSGHGARGDMTLLTNIVKPKFFIPIGGNIKHMRAYSALMQELGYKPEQILELLDGQSVIFENGNVKLGPRLKLREVYVDGNLVGDVGSSVLEERIQLSNNGIVVARVSQKNIEIITKGFIFTKTSKNLIEDSKKVIQKTMKNKKEADSKNDAPLSKKIERDLERFFYKETGRNPIVIVDLV